MKSTLLVISSIVLFAFGCTAPRPLFPPVVVKNQSLSGFKYVFISQTKNLTSTTSSAYGGRYGVYGSSSSKTINPSDIITGILLKQGYIALPDLKPELESETLIINYGESGTYKRGSGYTIEVTIQFVSAKSNSQVCTCTAEGQGQTEADDIRQAINRCLSELFSVK